MKHKGGGDAELVANKQRRRGQAAEQSVAAALIPGQQASASTTDAPARHKTG